MASRHVYRLPPYEWCARHSKPAAAYKQKHNAALTHSLWQQHGSRRALMVHNMLRSVAVTSQSSSPATSCLQRSELMKKGDTRASCSAILVACL
jgi:hypothetical protein